MNAHDHDRPASAEAGEGEGEGHGHGGWAMLLCCIPMIIALAFIVIGR